MVGLLQRSWWVIVLRGISAIVLALLILLWPSRTLLVLIVLFGIYTLIDGFLTLIAAVRHKSPGRQRWWLVFEGLMGVIAGVLTLVIPGISAQFILILLALWAITTGVAEIRSAVQLRREINGEWLLGLGGITSVLFGLLLLVSGGRASGRGCAAQRVCFDLRRFVARVSDPFAVGDADQSLCDQSHALICSNKAKRRGIW